MCFLFAGCVSGQTSNFFSSQTNCETRPFFLFFLFFTVKVWRIWRHPIRLLPVAIAAMSVKAESPAACWGNSGATWQIAPADWRKEVIWKRPLIVGGDFWSHKQQRHVFTINNIRLQSRQPYLMEKKTFTLKKSRRLSQSGQMTTQSYFKRFCHINSNIMSLQ